MSYISKEFALEFVHQTSKAILVKDGEGGEIWLPKSQVVYGTNRPEKGEVLTIQMPEWLAKRAGLIDEDDEYHYERDDY